MTLRLIVRLRSASALITKSLLLCNYCIILHLLYYMILHYNIEQYKNKHTNISVRWLALVEGGQFFKVRVVTTCCES
jgi:hypothetical protein